MNAQYAAPDWPQWEMFIVNEANENAMEPSKPPRVTQTTGNEIAPKVSQPLALD